VEKGARRRGVIGSLKHGTQIDNDSWQSLLGELFGRLIYRVNKRAARSYLPFLQYAIIIIPTDIYEPPRTASPAVGLCKATFSFMEMLF
jgi:hypothetical protein